MFAPRLEVRATGLGSHSTRSRDSDPRPRLHSLGVRFCGTRPWGRGTCDRFYNPGRRDRNPCPRFYITKPRDRDPCHKFYITGHRDRSPKLRDCKTWDKDRAPNLENRHPGVEIAPRLLKTSATGVISSGTQAWYHPPRRILPLLGD